MRAVRLILDNIRSEHNVGSIFRTADAAGVEHLYLCGITPTPEDRFGRPRTTIEKTALGATKAVPWQQVGTGQDLATREMLALLEQLKAEGFSIVAVEQCAGSVDLYHFKVSEKVVYILGAEVEGVQPEILAVADIKLELPMAGMKESLNVSVVAGIVLFQRP